MSHRHSTTGRVRRAYGPRVSHRHRTRFGGLLRGLRSGTAGLPHPGPALDELSERIKEAIGLYLEVEGETSEVLDFVGIQRVTIAS